MLCQKHCGSTLDWGVCACVCACVCVGLLSIEQGELGVGQVTRLKKNLKGLHFSSFVIFCIYAFVISEGG